MEKHSGLSSSSPHPEHGEVPTSDPQTPLEAPKRIQRKRTKGWKMPPNTVYVGRPTKLGNPFIVRNNPGDTYYEDFRKNVDLWLGWPVCSPEIAVQAYREMKARYLDVGELRGKDLACWCPLDQPCHADVLLEIANAKSEGVTDGTKHYRSSNRPRAERRTATAGNCRAVRAEVESV